MPVIPTGGPESLRGIPDDGARSSRFCVSEIRLSESGKLLGLHHHSRPTPKSTTTNDSVEEMRQISGGESGSLSYESCAPGRNVAEGRDPESLHRRFAPKEAYGRIRRAFVAQSSFYR